MARLNHDAYPVLDHTSLVSPVVFVVDMVNGFVKEGALADPAIAKCIAPIETLLKSCPRFRRFLSMIPMNRMPPSLPVFPRIASRAVRKRRLSMNCSLM